MITTGILAPPAFAEDESKSSDISSSQPCADVLFIGVRGSGENDHMGGAVGAARTVVKEGLASAPYKLTMRQVYLNYTSASVDVLKKDVKDSLGNPSPGEYKYFASIKDGIKKLNKVLYDSAMRCKTEKWVLTGYSQGAIVVNQATTYNASFYAGVYLIGDPSNFPSRVGHRYGTASSTSFGIYDKAVHLPVPTSLRSRFYSYCDRYDIFCDYVNSLARYGPPVPGIGLKVDGEFGGIKVHERYADVDKLKPSMSGILKRLYSIVPTVKDSALAACVKNQQKADGSPVSTTVTSADMAKLSKLICPLKNIHSDGINSWEELAYGTNLVTLQFYTEAPDQYQVFKPLAALKKLQSMKVNQVQCTLPLSAHGYKCV